MTKKDTFDLRDFMPYLLNQAADATSREFETAYKTKYGMLRADWRVLFHLGRYGRMTAKEICDRTRMHKTKVSRAVHALEAKGFLLRTQLEDDRCHEMLSLTVGGLAVYDDLQSEARRFDTKMMSDFSDTERAQIRQFLIKIAGL